jgi:hypothetical protein
VYELSYFDEKKISTFFGKNQKDKGIRKLDPYEQKLTKNVSHLNMTIHTPIDSPCQVDKKCAVSNLF